MIAVLVLLMVALVSSSVICPDGTKCQDKNTCCETNEGYACCHYPNAVCCLDKAHCCPQDFSCNLQTQQCVKQGLPWYSLPMTPQRDAEETAEKRAPSPAVEFASPSVSVVHCDNLHVCPDGTTCCRTPYAQWVCCPYNIGQCCPDGFHCCPYGYHCDVTSSHCLPGSHPLLAMLDSTKQATPMVPLIQAVDIQDQDDVQAGVIRCNGQVYCRAGNSCCRAPTGQWGCCPYPLGQCCKDGKHCCEYGYECDATFTKCQKGKTSIPARPKEEALFL